MGFWTAAALVGGSLLGGAASASAGNEAADAASDAARENNATTRYMFDQSVALNEPWRQAGMSALGQQYSLLGLTPQSAAPVNGGAPAGQTPGRAGEADYAGYVDAHQDLSTWFNALSAADRSYIGSQGYDADGNGQISKEEAGRFHWAEAGQDGGGHQLVYFGEPGSTNALSQPIDRGDGTYGSAPGSQISAGSGSAQDQSYQDFLNSGFNRSMTEVTDNDFDQIIGAFGAGGTAMSGSTQNALADNLARNRSTAFNNYYGALSGMSGTGANLSQAQGTQGLQTANALSANNNQAAAAQGSSYMNTANALNSTLQNGVNTYLYGQGQGWWGGGS